MHESGGIMVSPTHTHAPQQDHAPMHHAHAHTPTPTSRRPPLPLCPGPHQHAPHQVNYVYELATIDANHSAYVTSGAVAASPAVRALVALAE